MTFDHGPSLPTMLIYNGLKEAGVKATLHVDAADIDNVTHVGYGLPELVQSAYNQGSVIGLQFPAYLDAVLMSDADLKARLAADSDIIFELIGKYPKYLRMDSYNDRVLSLVQSLGFTVTGFLVDTDNAFSSEQVTQQYQSAMRSVTAGTARFISRHIDNTFANFDPQLMTKVKQSVGGFGYSLVTLDVCLGDASAYRTDNPGGNEKIVILAKSVPTTGAKATGTATGDAMHLVPGFIQTMFAAFVALIAN